MTPKYWGLYMATRYVVGLVLQCKKRQAMGGAVSLTPPVAKAK